MNTDKLQQFVNSQWDDSILPVLQDYVRIPNKSPTFDPDWAEHGHMDRAVELAENWCRDQGFSDAQLEIMRLPGRTPLLFMEIPGDSDDTVLLYGHLDKQPEFSGWEPGLEPWKPVIRGDKLYGRGGADDGYAVFASLTALRALREQNIPHSRCVVVIECCEESGSDDLPHYIDALGDRIGNVSLVVCLDAECGNYDQLWCTTSLRGNLVGTLTVDVLTEGVHSGAASGIVPGSFRVIRELLARVEDSASGDILLDALHVDIPEMRQEQAARAAAVLKDLVWQKFPFAGNTGPISKDPETLLLNNTWRPALAVTGAEGLPPFGSAGNVLRPQTALKLSFRLPPTADAAAAAKAVKTALEKDPPYGAKVSFESGSAMGGWNAPAINEWLAQSMAAASRDFFGAEAMYMGTGGSIPFMGLLGEKFPESQFLVTGLLGPKSNAHGPNEFLHIPTAKKLTACVARVVADHLQRG
ncbi:MAG TPA: M20 family metallopeptidase [Gammaproteobacteria bacterium]|nr:M20 family metallopeptidase [Gammaproteobacteria bacterium]